ncbi:MAG: hypothetical protein ROO76_12630 [Terriglobia bacterium]|nr:hypothetical protein [Terriglobia bacterium]
MILVPEGTMYEKTVIRDAQGYVPLTFAFYYPEADSSENSHFSAMSDAVARSIYEYQHVLYRNGTVSPIGTSNVDRSINDESRSQCWYDSALLSLTAGTHSVSRWGADPYMKRIKIGSESALAVVTSSGDVRKPSFSDTAPLGVGVEAETVAAYLRSRGTATAQVVSNDLGAMNAVLSVCRALTQNPHDLATREYPIEQVRFVPYFSEDDKQK